MSKKRKVVFVSNIPSPYSVDLFYYIQNNIKDFEFHIVYTNINESNRTWNIEKEKMLNTHILCSRIIVVNDKVDKRYVHIPSKLFKTLNSLMPDVVLAWEYNIAAIQSLIWCKTNRRKFIHATEGTLFSERYIGKIQKITRKIITSNCDAALASGKKAKEKLMKWGIASKKIFVGLLTVDIEPFVLGSSRNVVEHSVTEEKEKKIILYVGRITYGKGIDLLLNAIKYVENDYELRIVGEGKKEEIKEFKKMATELKILDKIVFCGYKSGNSLVEEYVNAAVFVFPTRDDCFGLVLLEAMCSLVPIVTSKYADGAYDIIEDNKNGLIVDPYNSREMARAIDYILSNDEIRKNFALYSIKQREKFRFEIVAKEYEKALKYVLRKRKRS